MTQKITIDGTEYTLDSLSESARNQINNLRATEKEIARTQQLKDTHLLDHHSPMH